MREVKQSTAPNVMVFMADSTDHITGKTALTLAVTISKDGAAFASISPTVTERGNGWYNVALATADTGTVGDLVVRATATGADPGERPLNVVANVEADTYGRVGAPTGASVSADVAAVKNDTGTTLTRVPSEVAQKSHFVNGTGNITPPTNTGIWDRMDAATTSRASAADYTSARAGKLDNLDATISSRLASASYTAPDNTTIGTINTKIGTPAGASVSADVAAVKSDSGTLVTRVPSEVAQKSHFVNGTGNITPPVNTGIWDRWDAAVTSRPSANDIWTNVTRKLTSAYTDETTPRDMAATGSGGGGGSIAVLPFSGSVQATYAKESQTVEIIQGDSISIPYDLATNLTGWTVFFGAKTATTDTAYSIAVKDITASVTDLTNGRGVIPLISSDTGIFPGNYIAEIEIRKSPQVVTAMRFLLKVKGQVIS